MSQDQGHPRWRTVRVRSTMEGMSVATYLADLDASLIGRGRVRRELVREAADHLEDATEAYVRAGHDLDEAEERAVSDFGSVQQVAPGFQTTVAVASARRTALILLAGLSIQPFLWDDGLALSASTQAHAPRQGWAYTALDAVIEIGGFLGLLGALGALVLTAIGQRWVRVGRRAAQVAAGYVMFAAVLVPVLGLAMMALGGGLTLQLFGLSLVLMVAPMAAAGISARRTLAAC